MNDAEAVAYYDDPAKRHVPVRSPAETIEQVTRLADAEGMTASTWIRRAVEALVP